MSHFNDLRNTHLKIEFSRGAVLRPCVQFSIGDLHAVNYGRVTLVTFHLWLGLSDLGHAFTGPVACEARFLRRPSQLQELVRLDSQPTSNSSPPHFHSPHDQNCDQKAHSGAHKSEFVFVRMNNELTCLHNPSVPGGELCLKLHTTRSRWTVISCAQMTCRLRAH